MLRICRTLTFALFMLVFAFSTTQTAAQKPPALGYVFPPVVVAGETTEVQLGGFDFTPDMQWFVHHDQIKLEILGPPGEHHLPPPPYWFGPRAITSALPMPREVPARIVVPKGVPAGTIRWQVANANGAASTATLLVSNGREGREIVEHRSRDLPQRLEVLPAAVSGRLSRLTEIDRYEFKADRDGLVSVDLMARRVGSDFLGVLEVRDASGKLLADASDTLGLDTAVTFAVRQGETYTVSLRDADFRGDRAYVYRLALRYGPRVICTLPAFGERGTTSEVEFVGIGVATGKQQLETIRQQVPFPTDKSIAAHVHPLETSGGTVDVTIPLSDLKEQTRNLTAAPVTQVAMNLPHAVTARFAAAETEHRYPWRASKDEQFSITAKSRAIGTSLDIALAILDSAGKPITENDDAGSTTDAAIEFRAPADGEYTCVVRPMSARTNSLDEVYRLQITRPTPDFSLTIPQQQLSVLSGGKAELTIQATRSGGFDGPIALVIDGLPPGVTTERELAIPGGQNETKLTIVAAADAAVVAATMTIRGIAKLGDADVSRIVTATAAGNLAPRTADETRIDRLLLAMTMTPPFGLELVDHERQRDVPRGTTYRAEYKIVRKNNLTGPMQIEMAAFQDRNRQGVRGPVVTVAADATSAIYPCFMPEWLSTDLTRRMVVHGVAAVPDPKGTPRYLIQPAVGRVTMIMEGALLKLTANAGELTVRPGESFDVPVALSRSAKLPIAAKLELVVPDELQGIISAEPVELPADHATGQIRIATKADARLSGDWPLTLKATALEDGKWPVVSQIEVTVRFQ